MTTVRISKNDKVNIISEQLFGCNMEITRTTGFGGIYAQMINNRKFYAHNDDEVCGFVYDGNTLFSTETEKSSCGSNFFVIPKEGFVMTDLDNTVLLQKDKEYTVSIYASGNGKLAVSYGGNLGREFSVDSENPTKIAYNFISDNEYTDVAAMYECTEGKIALYSVSLMPADHFHNFRRDVVECLKEIKPAQLRFPGGCFADHYDWKECLKDVDLRTPVDGKEKPFLLRNSYDQDCLEVSIDDFCSLCQYVGAAPELTVRLTKGSIEESVDLIEYCNGNADTKWGKIREQRGYKPFNVKEWYIGNEIYTFAPELKDDGEYAAKVTCDYVKAMKAVDPDIVTMATCYPLLPNWNTPYFEGTEATIDRYSFHYYLTCEFRKDWRNTPRDMVLGVIDKMTPELDRTLELFKSAKSGHEHTVSFDEWNYAWGINGSTEMMICNSLTFNFLCRDAYKYIIKKGLFFHPINGGMVAVNKKSASVDSSGELMKLFYAHRNAEYLDVACTCDGEYGVDAAASLKEGNTYITLVNKNTFGEQKAVIEGVDLCGKKITAKVIIPEEISFNNDNIKIDCYELKAKDGKIEINLPLGAIAGILIQ